MDIGLSPLARGTCITGSNIIKENRFIPAGAGNIINAFTRLFSGPVYPRWRGEYNFLPRNISVIFGLSPLARGIYRARRPELQYYRFIPAGAGNMALAVE